MKKQKEISKQDFAAYQKVQFSGITNMLDVETVSRLSNLTREKILGITKHYLACAKRWNLA